jgi:hypothetical protein
MDNPWRSLRMEAPYVYEADEPAIAAFNARASDEHRLQTDVLPEPFLGRKDAPIVLLNLNPSFDESANLAYGDPHAFDAWRKNAYHEPLAYPFYFLDPQFPHAGRARRWKQNLDVLKTSAATETIGGGTLPPRERIVWMLRGPAYRIWASGVPTRSSRQIAGHGACPSRRCTKHARAAPEGDGRPHPARAAVVPLAA